MTVPRFLIFRLAIFPPATEPLGTMSIFVKFVDRLKPPNQNYFNLWLNYAVAT
jgi:hypothetical protein